MITRKFVFRLWSKLRTKKIGKWLTKNKFTLVILNLIYSIVTTRNSITFKADGYKIIIDPADIGIGRRYIVDGEHEPVAKSYVERLDFNLFIEVGSNIGDWPLFLNSKLGSRCRYILFEPVPMLANRLRENLELNFISNYSLHRLAVSNVRNRLKIYLDPKNQGNNSVVETCVKDFDSVLEVESTTLDDIMCAENLGKSFLKVDAQGHEAEILAGAQTVLPLLDFLMIETSAHDWEKLQFSPNLRSLKIERIAVINEMQETVMLVNSLDDISELLEVEHYYDLVIHLAPKIC